MEEPEKLGGYFYHIGKIVTTSDMVTSMYGDTKLFFRHVRFEEDLDKKPEWLPHIEMFDRSTFVNNLPLPLESPAECPFDYLFGMMWKAYLAKAGQRAAADYGPESGASWFLWYSRP